MLMDSLRSQSVERLDYIIVQHAEQDHSGGLKRLLEQYPKAKVLGSARSLDLLAEFGLIEGGTGQESKDGDIIPLGGTSLQFIVAPWVHWPDTIFTYIPEERILFT